MSTWGQVSDFPPSWTDAKGRKAALGWWISRIAKEVGKHFDTHSERSEAEAFARSHRLSIANAFERRLSRGDVVAELLRLFQLEIKSKTDDPIQIPD